MSKTTLKTVVDSYDKDIQSARIILETMENAFKIFHCPKDKNRSVAEYSSSDIYALKSATRDRIEKLAMERTKYVCPKCGAPLVIDYEGSSLGDDQLFKVTTCSKEECDFLDKKEIKRNGNRV